MYRNHLSPPIFPSAWACDFGEDRKGLWMAFSYHDVRMALRWIQPGAFWMGSPEDEKGRWNWEVLHQVTLTQGFWLAETTVTQALWQAVMGNNPSEFKGDNLPVENVRWNDTQDFIQKLNTLLQPYQPEYFFRLPTEAEWEYACRAGTQTPFNFAGELSLDKVNYRGTWEYKSDEWGQGALQKTAPVKSYPCNDWGLYEMHGNVWEWCQDNWNDSLSSKPTTDPIELNTDSGRVRRGGSWSSGGRSARSAHRDWNGADYRRNYLGIRFALGLQALSGQVQASSQTRAGA